jgi:hypothetical protein
VISVFWFGGLETKVKTIYTTYTTYTLGGRLALVRFGWPVGFSFSFLLLR